MGKIQELKLFNLVILANEIMKIKSINLSIGQGSSQSGPILPTQRALHWHSSFEAEIFN